MGPEPRDPAEQHLGKGARDICIPDLRLGSGIIPGEPVEHQGQDEGFPMTGTSHAKSDLADTVAMRHLGSPCGG